MSADRPYQATGQALALAALTGPLVSVVAPLGLAPLLIAVALAALYDAWRSRLWPRPPRLLLALLAAFAGLGILSALWALDPVQALKGSLALAVKIGCGLFLLSCVAFLTPPQTARICRALPIGFAVALAVQMVGQFLPMIWSALVPETAPWFHDTLPPFRLSRGLTLLTLLCVPVAALVWWRGHRVSAIALVGLNLLAVLFSQSLASKIVWPLSCLVFLLLLRWRRPVLALSIAAVAALMLASAPLASLVPGPQETFDRAPWLPPSAHHRLTIWRFSSQHALDKPLLGWGFDASRSIPDADIQVPYWRSEGSARFQVFEPRLPLHPHSAPIQVWLEQGLAGIVLMLAILAVALWRIRLLPSWQAAMAGTTLISGIVIASVSYGLWQSWWQGSIWLTAALIAVVNRSRAQQD